VKSWIRDGDDTPQGFPLQRLLREVRARVPELGERVFVGRAWGYGLRVHALSTAVERVPRLEVVRAIAATFDHVTSSP
jgi:hypothetical protein